MAPRVHVLVVIGLCISFIGLGQENSDFDADSVLYTPIPKPKPKTGVGDNKVASTTKNFQYFLTLKSGSLSADRISFTTAIVQGVTLTPQLRAALGLGFDSYVDVSTVPLFVTSSFDLSRKKNALFLAFSGGVSKVWKSGLAYYVGQPPREVRGGYLINPEVGYRIRYHDVRLGLSVGWKSQRIKYYYEYQNNGYWDPAWGWVQGAPSTSTVKEDKRRVSVNLFVGWK